MDTEWLVEGAKVAVVCDVPGRSKLTVSIKNVERLTPKTVVVDGERYRRETLKRVGRDWGPSYEVLPLDDEKVQRILLRQREERVANALVNAAIVYSRDPNPTTRATVLQAMDATKSFLLELPREH